MFVIHITKRNIPSNLNLGKQKIFVFGQKQNLFLASVPIKSKIRSQDQIPHVYFKRKDISNRDVWDQVFYCQTRSLGSCEFIFSPLISGTFWLLDQIKDQDFSNLLVTFRRTVNMKLFFVVFPHIVLFRFEAKYKPGPNPQLSNDNLFSIGLGNRSGTFFSSVPGLVFINL